MNLRQTILSAAASLTACTGLMGSDINTDRPNILFLVIEDTSPYLFPVYGNKSIETPNLDDLALNGVVFTNAYSNGPQCSPARSTLISGTHATTYGNDFHRESHHVPAQYFFPALLREAGYFTVNAGKTDYNVTRESANKYYNKAWDLMSGSWSEKSPNATYNAVERNGKPFFAQFNNPTSHMSRMTTVSVEDREPSIVNPQSVELPPHVPDLPEVRSDYALHLDGIVNTDRWVGLFIDDLKKRGLYENTIIFFFSDHGGCLPRGKAFPYETGFRPALIVHAPEKWQHLLPAKPGTKTERIVEFADFGPTLLSIAGVKTPDYMTGEPFMGKYAGKEKKYAHNFRANTGYHFDPSRTVSDGQFSYTRNFTPYKIDALRQSFQFAMPAQLAWDKQYYDGNCKDEHKQYYEPKPNEMLFDLQNDPYELNNLSNKPEYRKQLLKMRKEMVRFMSKSEDIGYFPSDIRLDFTKNGIVMYNWVRETDYDLKALHTLVLKASSNDVSDLGHLTKALQNSRPEMRFWAASGIANLCRLGLINKVPADLYPLLEDDFQSVAAIAAEALVYAGETEKGLLALLDLIMEGSDEAISSVEELRELARPIAPNIYAYYNSGKKASGNFGIRSILINFGLLPFETLFTDADKKTFLNNHLKRIEEWAPTRP